MKQRAGATRIAEGCVWLTLLPAVAFAQAAEDIRDIRGPKSLPRIWLLPAVLAGIVIAALCIYLRWRRRIIQPRSLSLSERTLERLDGIRHLMQPGTVREFGIAASELMRDYIEKRFSVVATQRTTEEFLQALLQGSDDALTRHRSLLAEFLQQCDRVKFAGDSLAAADMESLLHSARRFVLETAQAPLA
jgi:hypothetical protein